MKLITDIENIQLNHTIITLGKFDGNHIGHQLLFETAVNRKEAGDSVVIFTFSVPPAKVLGKDPTQSLRTIQTHGERKYQHYPDGIDYVIEFPFNEKTRSMSPEQFVKNVLVDKLGVKTIVVGEDFRFGKDRAGSVDTLSEMGKTYGFEVIALKKVTYHVKDKDDAQEVSSTLIKEEIQKGNMEDVNAMLGCPFAVTGEVLHGKHYGRTIGFPTINLSVPEDKIMPPNGVYATKVCFDGRTLPSITNVGVRPTFDDGEQRTVETNIFDFNEDIYGKIVRVDFYKFIRPERKFASGQELMEEIQRNVIEVKVYFEETFSREK